MTNFAPTAIPSLLIVFYLYFQGHNLWPTNLSKIIWVLKSLLHQTEFESICVYDNSFKLIS